MSRRSPWDRLYLGMLPYHNSFRAHLASLHKLLDSLPPSSTSSSSEAGGEAANPSDETKKSSKDTTRDFKTLSSLLSLSLQLSSHLHTHHQIEETYIFPLLAPRLPQFAPSSQHVEEHEAMSLRLEELDRYTRTVAEKVRRRKQPPTSLEEVGFEKEKMKRLVEGLEEVLLPHLKEEEESLKSESLKRAGFGEEEVARIPM